MAQHSRSTGAFLLTGVALLLVLVVAMWSVWLALSVHQLRSTSSVLQEQFTRLSSLRDTLVAAERRLNEWGRPQGDAPSRDEWRRFCRRVLAESALLIDLPRLGASVSPELEELGRLTQQLQGEVEEGSDVVSAAELPTAASRDLIDSISRVVERTSAKVASRQTEVAAVLWARWNELWILAAVASLSTCVLSLLLYLARREAGRSRAAETALLHAHEEVGRRVEERTMELLRANLQLHEEIAERRKAEEASRDREGRLKLFNSVLVDLSRSDSISEGELQPAFAEIAQTASKALAVERVGIWLYNSDHTEIECVELFELNRGLHGGGQKLRASEYPIYFKALEAGRTLPAHDTMSDPRTVEFRDNYLTPLGITSMLDAIVRQGGRVVGVVCHEHVGEKRIWTIEEQAFAGSIADFVSLALQSCERRKAEFLLERQRGFLRQVIDTTPHMIFAKDRHGRFTLVNQAVAAAYGSTVENITGKRDADFNRNAEEVEHFRKDDLEVMTTLREKLIAEEVITDSRGQERWLSTVKRPILDEHGVANQVLGVATDITAMREAAHKLRDANVMLQRQNREMEEYASIAAHDLKRPAVALHGLLSFIKEDCGELLDPDSRENLDLALRECERMEHLISELSCLSRSRRMNVTATATTLSNIVNRCVKRFQHRVKERDISLHVDCEDGDVIVSQRQIDEALANLVENAIMHGCSGDTREINLKATLNGVDARIAVGDAGPGINPSEQESVFELFQRGSQSESVPGTGVGLFAVKRLMSQIGGSVELHSQPGHGATFSLVFPRRMSGSH